MPAPSPESASGHSLTGPEAVALAAAILAVALLYSSVGHGGASGYLAVMALFGLAPDVMRPAALTMNVFVASLGVYHFAREGWFSRRLWWPFALASVPAAAVGGALSLPGPVYRRVVGVALLWAAWHLFRTAERAPEPGARPPAVPLALAAGAGIGLLAGLTGVGGGIFLSPLLLAAGWAGARETAAVSAAFILANSAAGLAGFVAAGGGVPGGIAAWIPAAAAGGFVGSRLGARRLGGGAIRRLLALVLVVAAVKFLLLL
ncbi:MAG: sulfite exporter TauE/SafE family protein [Gemmatimonadota bacterium]|nr:sulfite exporter TauE/SafE family protein [Gemmatimonadota bacterium]